MRNAAHAESLQHTVYHTPLKVVPEFEYRDTPSNYVRRRLGTETLPNKMKVWRIQEPERDNVVSRAYGFLDSPDTEVLAVGFNTGKEYGAVGIGRHGNFLQWGYGAVPSEMTDAGRKLFLNCIHYIYGFNGKPPFVHRQASHRLNALRLAPIINRISGDQKEFFLRTFPEELYEKYSADPEGLTQYYRDNLEWIYRDRTYRVDEDLKALGIGSNRQIGCLEELVTLLSDESKTETAKKALARYTEEQFESTDQWQNWFDENKKQIFFTDVGGYKFLVAPDDYPVSQSYKNAIGALSPTYCSSEQ
ncbi:hypothetical protein ACFL6U_03685 [Planctomycetota bacterium]